MFNPFQLTRSRREPIHLYEIVWGSGGGNTYRYTDGEVSVTHNGFQWEPTQIRHTEINSSGTLDKSSVEIEVSRLNPLVEVFRTWPPNRIVSLTIIQGERRDTDAEFLTLWKGRILNFNLEGLKATLTGEPVGTSTRRPGLRRNFQYGCPHVLYGPHCRASRAGRSVMIQPLGVNGAVVEVATGWNGAFATDKYVHGLAEWTNNQGDFVSRSILRVEAGGGGHMITLAGLATGLEVTHNLTLLVGCNHQMSDCTDLHQNVVNYGGCPWIPLKNPIGTYNIYY
jgi:hypothetical protein